MLATSRSADYFDAQEEMKGIFVWGFIYPIISRRLELKPRLKHGRVVLYVDSRE